ncbi:MAG: FAD-dependent oxidoreductase [Terrimonas sp.]|nr:FAD-dependent oxidoreductase [Terrimonas sp.]
MRVDFLLIGQGIAGTWLSYYLSKKGASIIVIDDAAQNAASRVAAGIINPVTGRRVVRTWMIEELLPFAASAYEQMGKELGITALLQKDIIDFFSAPDIKLAFEKRLQEGEGYLKKWDSPLLNDFFHVDFGWGMISPVYMAQLEDILPAWRLHLTANQQLAEEKFDPAQLFLHDGHISYRDIIAQKIIFCDGVAAANNPWFSKLPFALHKGEALILEIPDLPRENIYKKGLTLVPLKEKNYFWLGSNYLWEYKNDLPTEKFQNEARQKLNYWLKLPFRIMDHKAALRPANVERRPFVGIHPLHPSIGIFNGMGTKGCSLAPYFAKQFAEFLLSGEAILPEADINRFQKILSRT